MNKKLLTLAVSAALAAGMSVAQAEVAVYGKAHVSIDVQDNDAENEETFISDNSSRFGVRVSEDLGGGLKGLAQWEIGARTDTNTALSTNRNSFLGLASDSIGTIRVGKYDTPYKDIGRKADLFNERIGDSRNVIGLGSTNGAFDARVPNMVRYDSPSFGGLQVAVLYSADEGTTAPATATRYGSASVSYTGGPLFVALGYEDHNTLAGPDNETGIRLGAGFKTGALTLNALYETLSDIGNTATTAGADVDNYGVGAAFKFGNATAKAQYYISDTGDLLADSELMAVGLDYSFSKTVTGYVAYAQADNDAALHTHVASGNGGHGDIITGVPAAGSPSAFSVGMEMNF
jgi:predicted porin